MCELVRVDDPGGEQGNYYHFVRYYEMLCPYNISSLLVLKLRVFPLMSIYFLFTHFLNCLNTYLLLIFKYLVIVVFSALHIL